LQQEQESGLLPKFRFIGLNGIEQRHPFDAYIKFWEALTGNKHVGSHEKACERLEEYFTSSPSFVPGSKIELTTVVVLDEIDYLITEKQSVLYNFFDWPKRAQLSSLGKRLVVVGVRSNGLNDTYELH
jgi:origin recognition complex subunit 1